MSHSFVRAGLLLGFVAGVALQAQPTNCTDANFDGTYFYLSEGAYVDNGAKIPYTELGKVIADGKGNVTGNSTFHNGTVVNTSKFSGSYTVNGNCSGTESLSITAGSATYPETNYFQITSEQGAAVTTDAGDVVAGMVYYARTTCNLGSLRGTFGGSQSGFLLSPADFSVFTGQITFDGKGGATYSGNGYDLVNGTLPGSGSGTYSLNSDCTGTATVGGVAGVIALTERGSILYMNTDTAFAPSVGMLNPVGSNVFIPHIAVNGGWNTDLVFVNSWPTPVTATVNFIAADGTPWSLNIMPDGGTATMAESSTTISIPANARVILHAIGDPTMAAAGGWADVTSPTPITAYAVFGWPLNGQASAGVTQAVAYNACGGNSSITVPFDNTNGRYFGVALANLANESANVTATVYNSTGSQAGQATFASGLAAGGHTQNLLSNVIASTAGTSGTVTLTSSVGSLAITPLQFNSNGSFTSVPVPCP